MLLFQYDPSIRRDHPGLVTGVLEVAGIVPQADAASVADPATRVALERLAAGPEGEFPEIRAWRQAFARMGLKPTQYRCASESLLRRLRKEGSLPPIHPAIDLCNALSAAFATPVAVFDLAQVDGGLTVRPADGDEDYLTLAGELEQPKPGEVIFADASRHAHARRWTNRQSGRSAVRPETARVLVVAEALHGTAPADVPRLTAALADAFRATFPDCAVREPEIGRGGPFAAVRT